MSITVFDGGAAAWEWVPGFYDRYLTHCRPDACIASVSFECQKKQKKFRLIPGTIQWT